MHAALSISARKVHASILAIYSPRHYEAQRESPIYQERERYMTADAQNLREATRHFCSFHTYQIPSAHAHPETETAERKMPIKFPLRNAELEDVLPRVLDRREY